MKVYLRQRPDHHSWQAFWTDPATGKRKTKALKATAKKDAIKEAAILEDRLASQTSPGNRDINWSALRERFDDEYLPSRAVRTQRSYRSAMNQFEELMGSPRLSQINVSLLSQYQAKLQARGCASAYIAQLLRHLKACLRWAEDLGIIARVPKIKMPRIVSSKLGKGRPLTEGEFEHFKAAIPKAIKDSQTASDILRFVEALWLSGLRLGEASALSWTAGNVRVDLDGGEFPRILWAAWGQKSRRDEITPLTPDFAEFLQGIPANTRGGLVLPVRVNKKPVGAQQIGRLVSAVGDESGILTGDSHATAHDFRRSFATRWSRRLRPITLKTIMRHSDIKTTLQYYVAHDSDDIARELWGFSRSSK